MEYSLSILEVPHKDHWTLFKASFVLYAGKGCQIRAAKSILFPFKPGPNYPQSMSYWHVETTMHGNFIFGCAMEVPNEQAHLLLQPTPLSSEQIDILNADYRDKLEEMPTLLQQDEEIPF